MEKVGTYKDIENMLIRDIKSVNKQKERYICFGELGNDVCKRLRKSNIFAEAKMRPRVLCSKFGEVDCPDVCNKYKSSR